jgi:multisubunit Na+/H+ antiporter MnhG subunit
MTESQPEPTTANASPEGATREDARPVDVKGVEPSFAKRFWWVPASFLVPFAATYLNLMTDVHARADAIDKAVTIGAIGLASAVLINVIWYLDCNWGGKQFFGRSSDTAAKILVCALGIVLWLTWTCVGIAISMSYEQVNVVGIYH